MEIRTTRFGSVQIEPEDVIAFPTGMLGLDECHEWVLLADAHNDALGWLQSTTQPEVALAVVSPRRFVPEYQPRVLRSELGPLATDPVGESHVLAIVSADDHSLTLNLKAPLVINLQRRLGRQVIVNGDLPVQYELRAATLPMRRAA